MIDHTFVPSTQCQLLWAAGIAAAVGSCGMGMMCNIATGNGANGVVFPNSIEGLGEPNLDLQIQHGQPMSDFSGFEFVQFKHDSLSSTAPSTRCVSSIRSCNDATILLLSPSSPPLSATVSPAPPRSMLPPLQMARSAGETTSVNTHAARQPMMTSFKIQIETMTDHSTPRFGPTPPAQVPFPAFASASHPIPPVCRILRDLVQPWVPDTPTPSHRIPPHPVRCPPHPPIP